jgi:uncharacterized protein (DUF2147 family)
MRKFMTFAAVALAAAISASASARADAIDGNWCGPEGRHLFISGPTIITEDGAKLQGQYSRHAFAYTIPAPARDAGQSVLMRLLNETTMAMHPGESADTPWQTWRRCDATS